jgi:cytochrome bd-type quinol oxidase subunit 2
LLFLVARRTRYFQMLSGAPVGQPTSGRLVDATVGRGIGAAAGASLRGSAPLLLPLYVAGVYAAVQALGMPWRDSVTDNWWGFAWVLMPLACLVLMVRSVTRLRPRVGAVLMCLTYLAGAVVAAMAFVAYPYMVG